MSNDVFNQDMIAEAQPCFQYHPQTGDLVSNIPFRLNVWSPGNAGGYQPGTLVFEDRTINPTLEFDFPVGSSVSDVVMAMEFEREFFEKLRGMGYAVNPRANAQTQPDEVAQARQRVEGVDFSKALNNRPQSVDDLSPNRGQSVERGSQAKTVTMSETPSDDLLKTTIIAVERVKSSNGSTGYKLYRENDGQRQSVGAVWIEKLMKGLEGAVTKDITALDIGDMTSIPPVTAFYRKGKPTGQGGFYNDFVRFEAAS